MRPYRAVLLLVLLFLPAQLLGQTFLGSKNSNKYHYRHCRFAQSLSAANKIEFRSADEAVAAGFVACKVCKPPIPKSAALQQKSTQKATQSTAQQSTHRRCQGTTTKGTRCKRNALPNSNYCILHKK